MPSTSLILKGTGAVLMLHAAYSCMHYRSILQDLDLLSSDNDASSGDEASATEDSTTTTMMIPPVDVYIEVAIAFFMILAGELISTGLLQSVELFHTSTSTTSTTKRKHKSLAAPAYRTRDFDIYTNRSKAMIHRSTSNGKSD